MIDCHYVLVGKNGKQASWKDQKRVASQLVAIAKNEGGITDLLIPKCLKELALLKKANERYRLKKVRKRLNGEWREERDAVQNDAYMVALAELYIKSNGKSQISTRAVVNDFSTWIARQLQSEKSAASSLTEALKLKGDLGDRKSSWWKKQIAERRKSAS